MFVVFDLDGTLANTDHRQHLVVAKDWRGFYAACDKDPPHNHIIQTLTALVAAGHRVEIWSGRSDEVKEKTEEWLVLHGMSAIPLRMRKAGDYTPDDVLKRSWLNPVDMPDMIFDDRAKVVNMWREMGIPCCQVAPGEF